MKKDMFHAKVIDNKHLNGDLYDLYIHCPAETERAKTGQFVSLFTGDASMVLPRPLSLCDINKTDGVLRIVYRAGGDGTKAIAKLKKDDTISGIGPVGNAFRIVPTAKKVALVGGGIGTPPLLELAKKIREEVAGAEIYVYLGFRGKDQVILEEDYKQYTDHVVVTTDDGSYGHHGNIISAMPTEAGFFDALYSCGPTIMLKFVSQYATDKQVKDSFVSLEEHMACSIGACLACVTKIKTDTEQGWEYRRVCCSGPVFKSQEVIF